MSANDKHVLNPFFYPKSVAVVGASNNEIKANYWLVNNLVNLKYTGKIYPVNHSEPEVYGLKAYPGIASVPDDVEMAVISVAYNRTLEVVKDCIAKKIKYISITSGGFSERGENGRSLQGEIYRLMRENGVRAVGPNALSPICTENNFIVAFGPVYSLPRGGLSMIFQSGLYQPRFNWLTGRFNLRMNKLIDLGNKMDVDETEALGYLAQDPGTRVIAIHLESIAGDARKFMSILKKTTPHKPVIVLKSGRTEAGARAASSHTGAIVKSGDTVFDVALKQAGAIRAASLDEFFDLAKAFEFLPPIRNNRIALSVFSGGEGVIVVDACQAHGLTLAELSVETRQKLATVSPPWGEIPSNPFDHGVSFQFHDFPSAWEVLINALLDDPAVDCLVVHTLALSKNIAENMVRVFRETAKKGKPVVSWLADPTTGKEMVEEIEKLDIPFFPSGERAVKALAAVTGYCMKHSKGTSEPEKITS